MTTLHCNHDASGNFDTLTDEHSASSYGQPVLIHDGNPHGPADRYDLGLFGYCQTRDVDIRTSDRLTDDQVKKVQRWRNACAEASQAEIEPIDFATLYPDGAGVSEN